MNTLYYSINGREQKGPVTKEEFIRLRLSGETLVWFEGLPHWVKAADVVELKAMPEASPVYTVPPIQESVHEKTLIITEEQKYIPEKRNSITEERKEERRYVSKEETTDSTGSETSIFILTLLFAIGILIAFLLLKFGD